MAFGLYLHIPYCPSRCFYCDFYARGGATGVPGEYLDALLGQIRFFRSAGCWPHPPGSVYLGGGTPSLLTPRQLELLLRAADPDPAAEITLEANPDTLDLEKLKGYRSAGANRLSVGVQAASDRQLQRLGRRHTAQAARRALALAHEAGFENISGDLMLALPHDTPAALGDSLSLLFSGGATHISSYLLRVEPHTRFGLQPPDGLPGEDEAADLYLYAVRAITGAGYAQYEVSNFAKPGFESRHNLLYWDCEDYLGIGPAAHSCMAGRRFYYPPDLKNFLAPKPRLVPDGLLDAQEYIMLQTRLCRGLSLPKLQRRWGVTLTAQQRALLAACEGAGLCRLTQDRLTLTPRGMLVQNSLLTRVFF